MICMMCGSDDDYVIETRNYRHQKYIRRIRKCRVCGFKYVTHERFYGPLPQRKAGRPKNVSCETMEGR